MDQVAMEDRVEANARGVHPRMVSKSPLKRAVQVILLLLAIFYAGDYASVRWPILKRRNPFGVVKIQRYYAVMKKDGKPDFYFDQPENQTCVHSLFPHLGYVPCWYLNRRRVQRIDM
ncbi:MAG TPA: hypothetical protein VFD30_05985 [Terriglobia bacterium]|jgi:hypothetical protein|nr:hypothetical protein [Terriglobia bacterium]